MRNGGENRMNKRQLHKAFKDLGIPREDYEQLLREEMQALYDIFMLAETWEAMLTMFRIAPAFKRMTDILQGKETNENE